MSMKLPLFGAVGISAILSGGIILAFVNLELARTISTYPSQNGVADEWGYGQITAVLLWVPFCWTVFTAAMDEIPFVQKMKAVSGVL
jgi:hypothetical protein